jgi:outer membrane protein TolC
LDNAIRVARINNPELAATAHEVSAAEARGDIANGQRLPSLHAIAAYTSYLNDQRLIAPRGNGELGVFSRDIVAGDLVVSMPLFTGGRITSEIRAAELLRQSAEHHLARTREELVFNVSSVFYSILSQKKVIESLGFSRKTLEEHLKRVDDLIAVEKAAKVDRLRTEVRLADLDQRTVQEKNILAIQVRVLENLMGLKDSHPPLDVAGDLASDEAGPTPSLEEELSRAIGSRDDYLSARAELEAQAKSVDAARAAQWPTVSLQGAYGGRWAADASEHPSGTSRSDDVGVAGVVVDVPIFEGGRIEARIREERARLAATRERLRKLELQIRLDVETAFLNVASSRERVAATEKAIEQAKESLRIEREKYDLGKGAIIDVLDAQTALLDSQTNYYRALADYSTAHAQLRLVVGEKR